jgi:hypothetical protein
VSGGEWLTRERALAVIEGDGGRLELLRARKSAPD